MKKLSLLTGAILMSTCAMKTRIFSASAACAAYGVLLFLGSLTAQAAPVNTTNLLINPGAETGDLTGWTVGVGNPGVDNGTYDPGINPRTGPYDFYGNGFDLGTLNQTVALIGNQGITAADINTGTLFANVSFWEQGLDQGPNSDQGQVTLTFLGAGNTILSTVSTPHVDSHNLSWEQGTGSFLIPGQTESIEYTMSLFRNVGVANDSYIDDNSLTISGPAPITGTPEPSSLSLLVCAGVGVALLVRRSSLAAKARS